MAADNSTEPSQSKIIRKVYGRDVVPVWSLPYVNLKGWRVLAGVEAMLQSLAHQACGAAAPEFLTAYSLNANGGPVPIDSIQCEDCLDYVASITHGYKQTEVYQRHYGEWRDSIAKYVPSQAFLYVDELSAWYYATIENNVDEDEHTIFALKLDAEGERTVRIPYRREDYRLSLDPLIPREVVERHQEWFVLDSQQDGGHDCQPRQKLKAEAGIATDLQTGNRKLGSSPTEHDRNESGVSSVSCGMASEDKKPISEREQKAYVNITKALYDVISGDCLGMEKHQDFTTQADLIKIIESNYTGAKGGAIKSIILDSKTEASVFKMKEMDLLNTVATLLDVIKGNCQGMDKHHGFINESDLIKILSGRYEGIYGLSESNLSRKLPAAKRSLHQ